MTLFYLGELSKMAVDGHTDGDSIVAMAIQDSSNNIQLYCGVSYSNSNLRLMHTHHYICTCTKSVHMHAPIFRYICYVTSCNGGGEVAER